MKNVFKSINRKCCAVISRLQALRAATRAKLAEENGQFVVDHAVVFVICIAIGSIVLVALTTFVNTDMAPALKNKILGFI